MASTTYNVAPGIYTSETDLSQIIANNNDLILCVVGGATQGPLDTPTRCNTRRDLYSSFGFPISNDLGLLTACRFLDQGSPVVYLRVANRPTATAATYTVSGTSNSTSPTYATGTIAWTGSVNPNTGDYVTLRTTVPTINLSNDNATAAGNQTITLSGSGVTGRFAVTGMSGGTSSSRAAGTIQFINSSNAVSGDTIIISDGNGNTSFTFSGSTSGQSASLCYVAVGANAYASQANLISTINVAPGTNEATFQVSAADASAGKTFEFTSTGIRTVANSVLVTIGATAAVTKNNLIGAIAGQINSGVSLPVPYDATTTFPVISLTNALGGSTGNATILVSGTNTTVGGLTGGVTGTAGGAVSVMQVSALYPGSYGNNISIVVASSIGVGAPSGSFDLTVLALRNGNTIQVPVETFRTLNLNPLSTNYAPTVISNGIANVVAASQYISLTVLSSGGTPNTGTYALGTGGGTVGADGLGVGVYVPSDIVGTDNGVVQTGLKTLYNTDQVKFNILSVPGQSDVTIVNELTGATGIGESRQDCVCLIDPPIGLNPYQWDNWINGINVPGLTNQPTSPVNTTYSAFFAGWVKIYSNDLKINVWYPPSAVAAAQIAYAYRKNKFVWAAPAGISNGNIKDAILLEYSPTLAQRNVIQDTINGHRVNPLLTRNGIGTTIEGNRTLYRTNSALARFHVRMLLNYLKAASTTALLQVQWKPINQDRFTQTINLLTPIFDFAANNGAFDNTNGTTGYQIICDGTNNTSNTISQDTLVITCNGTPASLAETIQFNLNVYRSGSSFTIN